MSEKEDRVDPTMLLPEEPMVYEFKKKKKKKKHKHKHKQEDPLMAVEEVVTQPDIQIQDIIDPEVSIKVENIEVELDFNEFTNNSGLMLEAAESEESQEQAIPVSNQSNNDAVILTFENITSFKDTESKSDEPHTCNICHLIFKTKRTLNLHQRNKHKAHKKSFKYICDDCGMCYDKRNSLIAHSRRKHSPNSVPNDTEQRICDICSLVFKGMMRLRMHMRRKHDSFGDTFEHKCFDCGLTYDKYRSLLVHQKRKHSKTARENPKKWYNCPLCPKVFTSRDTYVRHVQRKHNQENETKVPKELLDNLSEANTSSGEIPCKECPLVFANVTHLKLHMRRTHNAYKDDFRLKCTICNLSYDKIESLKRHIRRKHASLFFCEVCNKQFGTKLEYINHTHEKAIIECTVCGLIFASQGGLRKHLTCTHKVDIGPKTIICYICKESFYDNKQLKAHLMKKHLNINYPCKFCSKTLNTKESYRRHILKFHSKFYPQTTLEHKCNMCPGMFKNEVELCRHIESSHSKTKELKIEDMPEIKTEIKEEIDQKLTFQCTKCSESCTNWEELRKHYEQFHFIAAEKQCQLCGQLVPENDLPKHMKLDHPTQVQMSCTYCDFETTSKASLTQHTLRHQNATTLNCEYPECRYRSYSQTAMEKHKKKHEELGVKLQCSHCPFQTMNKYILKNHEEAHVTGKKRYACNECDYATILPASLVQHKYKHSTVKRFKCEYCSFATKYNTSLRFHVKKKHSLLS